MSIDTSCWVYVICDDFEFCDIEFAKIGMASSPYLRLKQLQTGNPKALYIDKLYLFEKRSHAEYIEKRLHEIFRIENISGEWFLYSEDFAKKLNSLGCLTGEDLTSIQDDEALYDEMTCESQKRNEVFNV